MNQTNRSLLQELEERLRFETLLVDISAGFVNLRADQVDGEIEHAQSRVCECLGADMSALWLWSVETPYILTLTHLYRPLGGPPPPDRANANQLFPWCLQQLSKGLVVAVSSMDQLPPEAARDQEVCGNTGSGARWLFRSRRGKDHLLECCPSTQRGRNAHGRKRS